MRPIPSSLIFVILLIAGTAAAQWTEVPLRNTGFEAWTDGVADGWELLTAIDPDGCTHDCTLAASDDAHDGDRALLLAGDGETCRWTGLVQSFTDFTAGQVYRLSGWMKTTGVDPAGRRHANCQFFAIPQAENGQRLGYYGVPLVGGTTDWTRYSVIFPVNAGVADYQLGAFLSVPGMALFDDLRLERLETPTVSTGADRHERWRADIAYTALIIRTLHPDPWAHITAEDFQARIDALTAAIDDLDDATLTWRLRAAVCSLQDSHTSTDVPAGVLAKLPVSLYWFDDGIHVVAVAAGHEALLGARLTAIDGRPLAKILAGLRPQIACTSEGWFHEQAVGWLAMPGALHGLGLCDEATALTLGAVDDEGYEISERVALLGVDAEPEFEVAGPPEDQQPLYRRRDRLYWFTYLPESRTLYMKYDSCREDPERPLKTFGAELVAALDANPVDRFVLDVRHNAGGSNLINGLFRELGRRVADGRIGQTFVITGRRTYSAAVYDADAMRQRTAAVVVGEPTGMAPVHPGQVASFKLPGSGLELSCSTKMIQASQDTSPALMPDIETTLTWDDFLAGRDPALAAVLAYEKK